MRKQLLAFAIALAILIIVISSWVVWKSVAEKISSETPTTGIAETATITPAVIENKNLTEAIAAGKDFSVAGELEKAAAAFAATAARYPAEIEPLILLAETQVNLEEFEKARANLKAAEQLDAVNPNIFILRGRIFLQEEKFAEAEVEFGKAGEHGKFWQGVMAAFFDRRDEAKKLFAETDDDRSFEFLKAFLEWESFPDSPKTHLDTLLTKSFVQIGEYELALAKIGPVLEDDADYRDAWLLTGYAQFAQKNFELAKQSWETAFALDSGKPETQYFLGLVNFELDDLAEAEKFFLLARENKMTATDLGAKLAETYLQQGKYRAAADLLAEEIAKNRTTTLTDFVKPISLYLDKLQDGRNAWNLANLAKQRFPEEAFAQNLAGWVSLSNGYLPEARVQLERSIELNPQLPWPYFNLGKYFEKTENQASALAAYRETFELDTNGPAGVLAAQNYNRLLGEIQPPVSKTNSTEHE